MSNFAAEGDGATSPRAAEPVATGRPEVRHDRPPECAMPDKGFAREIPLMSMGRLDSDLEDLYRRRHGAFQVMLASVTGSVESSRDVVQEAFVRALQSQNDFRGDGSLEGWVWRIAFRVAVGSQGSRELPTKHARVQYQRPPLRQPHRGVRWQPPNVDSLARFAASG